MTDLAVRKDFSVLIAGELVRIGMSGAGSVKAEVSKCITCS